MASSAALTELRAKLPELKVALEPEKVILFGSQARGTATEDSDIDVVIVADSFREVKRPNRHRSFFKILWQDRSVDLICLTPEEFEKLRQWPGVVGTADREGIHLM
ncbi:MAG: nucleotidyltransferase domain-containing protein [Armatimonadia bacterium]